MVALAFVATVSYAECSLVHALAKPIGTASGFEGETMLLQQRSQGPFRMSHYKLA